MNYLNKPLKEILVGGAAALAIAGLATYTAFTADDPTRIFVPFLLLTSGEVYPLALVDSGIDGIRQNKRTRKPWNSEY